MLTPGLASRRLTPEEDGDGTHYKAAPNRLTSGHSDLTWKIAVAPPHGVIANSVLSLVNVSQDSPIQKQKRETD